MKFRAVVDSPADAIVVPVFSDGFPLLRHTIDRFRTARLLPQMGARQTITWFYGRDGEADFLLIGLGDSGKFQEAHVREAAGEAGRAVLKERRASAAVSFAALQPSGSFGGVTPETFAAWVEGWKLGTYSFDRHKRGADSQHSDDSLKQQQSVDLLGETGDHWQVAIRLGELRADSVSWARDMKNEPPNLLRPRMLAERVKERFAGTGVQLQVYEGDALESLGFAGTAAVGRGSAHAPAFIELRHCTDASLPLTALIGKGITFDTGGISLKHDRDISDMRMDMGGAAGVLAALDIIVRSGAPANVAVLVPAAENCPSDRSLLPGELIRYGNGLTVQVGNTDSEGRLVLADALIHAHRIGATEAIDMATLTYSVVGALGTKVAGILGNDDALVRSIQEAGAPFAERMWQLPLIDEYEEYLDSDYADTSNISRVGEAGAITAALFLRKFVHASLRWAHIDISGPKDCSAAKGDLAIGATGYGARTLASYLTNPRS